jgi:hypothetical protein
MNIPSDDELNFIAKTPHGLLLTDGIAGKRRHLKSAIPGMRRMITPTPEVAESSNLSML